MKRVIGYLVFALVAFVLASCGGSGGTLPASSIRISPAVTGTTIGQKISFTAFLGGGSVEDVAWTVVGGSANGLITGDGVYTAPGTPGTYRVRVTASSDSTVFAEASINVASVASISISPVTASARYNPGTSITFTPSIAGADPSKVTWRVVEVGGGTITTTGSYTAPSTPGAYTVECALNSDSSVKGSYQVVVSDTKLVKLTTSKGEVLIRMAQGEAPNTTANFINLARSGFYDGIYFHRYGPTEALPQFIQGGDPLTKTLPLSDPSIGTGGPGYTINFETNPLKHLTGSIAMARSSGLNTAGSQFYICGQDIPNFDGNYVVFGRVLVGLEVAQSLRKGDQIIRATVID